MSNVAFVLTEVKPCHTYTKNQTPDNSNKVSYELNYFVRNIPWWSPPSSLHMTRLVFTFIGIWRYFLTW